MTLKATIAADRANIFLDPDSSPHSVSAVYTPEGGIAENPVQLLFSGVPIHGDEFGENGVEQAKYVALGNSSDVSHWKLRGTVYLNSTTYQIINNPYPDENNNNWSMIDLRLPKGRETLI